MIIKKCLFCGNEFTSRNSMVKRKYCSRSCAVSHWQKGRKLSIQHKINMRKANAWKYEKEILLDYQKGDAIIWLAKRYKSNKRIIRNILKNHSVTFRGRKGIQAWNKGKHLPQIAGANSPHWKGGITPLNQQIRHCPEYRNWIEQIFRRDNWTCTKCNQIGGNLEADHFPKPFCQILVDNEIKTFEDALKCSELWDISNGRTICLKCHNRANIKPVRSRFKKVEVTNR